MIVLLEILDAILFFQSWCICNENSRFYFMFVDNILQQCYNDKNVIFIILSTMLELLSGLPNCNDLCAQTSLKLKRDEVCNICGLNSLDLNTLFIIWCRKTLRLQTKCWCSGWYLDFSNRGLLEVLISLREVNGFTPGLYVSLIIQKKRQKKKGHSVSR